MPELEFDAIFTNHSIASFPYKVISGGLAPPDVHRVLRRRALRDAVRNSCRPIAHRNPRQHHDLIKPLVVNVLECAVDVTELSKASPLLKHKLGGPGLPATTSPIPESTHVWATLAAVIMCLTTLGKPLHSILIQVLVWVGDLIEQSDWLARVSSDMLALPNYQGVKRSRHMHPAFKAAVCMDASSSCAASGSSASAALYQL